MDHKLKILLVTCTTLLLLMVKHDIFSNKDALGIIRYQIRQIDAEIARQEARLNRAGKKPGKFETYVATGIIEKRQKEKERLQNKYEKLILQMGPVSEALVKGCAEIQPIFKQFLFDRTVLSLNQDLVYKIAFSDDSTRLLTLNGNKELKVWDTSSGNLKCAIQGNLNDPNDMALTMFTPDGKHIIYSSGNDIGVLDVETGTTQIFRTNALNGLIALNSELILSATAHIATVRDIKTGNVKYALDQQEEIRYLYVSSNREALYTGSDHKAIVWDVKTGKEKYHVDYENEVRVATFSPNNQYFIQSVGKDVIIYDGSTGAQLRILSHENSAFITDIDCCSPDSSHLVSCDVQYTGTVDSQDFQVVNSKAIIWDLNTGAQVRTFDNVALADLAYFSPNGRYIATASHALARVWDTQTGKLKGEIDFLISSIYGEEIISEFSSDSRIFLCGDADSFLGAIDLKTSATIGYPCQMENTNINLVKFSPDSTKFVTLFTAPEGVTKIKLWQNLYSFIDSLTIDQCDLLRAIQLVIMREKQLMKIPLKEGEAMRHFDPLFLTKEQWHVFTSLPMPIQIVLQFYVKQPARSFKGS